MSQTEGIHEAKAKPQEVLCTVTDHRPVAAGTFQVSFSMLPAAPFKAGQFISLVIPASELNPKDVRRAYSIASFPELGGIQLCVALVQNGPGSTFLSKLKPGQTVKAYFPYGDFIFRTLPTRNAFFVATGTGISPFRSITMSQSYRAAPPRQATLLFGARTREDLLYMDELSKVPGLKRINCLSREDGAGDFFKGRVTDYLRNLGPDFPWAETDFYLCGNGAMIKEVEAFLKEKGLGKDAIKKEAYYQPR